MASDADIDRMLLEHAARWQATIRTNASIDVGTFRGGASRGPFAVAMITVAAFGVVAAAVAVNSVGPLTPSPNPGRAVSRREPTQRCRQARRRRMASRTMSSASAMSLSQPGLWSRPDPRRGSFARNLLGQEMVPFARARRVCRSA